MSRETASSIFKLTAILLVFAGLILISVTFIQLQTISNMFNGFGGQMETGIFESSFRMYGYTTPVIIIVWGILLYLLNRPLSQLVAEN